MQLNYIKKPYGNHFPRNQGILRQTQLHPSHFRRDLNNRFKSNIASPQSRPNFSEVVSTTSSTSKLVSEHTYESIKPLGYWLLGTAGLVAGMVSVGGMTRLTKSGLSMTDWKIQGSMPPITREEWEREFDRYKTFPEYQQRKNMTLEEFKVIFWWEYGHRQMGRGIGLAYTLPLIYFAATKQIPKSMFPRLGFLFALGGGQGLIGWWMVKSGLEVDPNQRKEIRVSPYRLATHLGMAFTTYTALLWTGLTVLQPESKLNSILPTLETSAFNAIKRIRTVGIGAATLIASTIISGAYVAGNDAGRAYNTWPKMGDDWIPMDDIWDADLGWRNFTENTATVQFDHRMLAMSSLGTVASMFILARRNPKIWSVLPANTKKALTATIGMAGIQVSLGISTLLLYVPVSLGVLHQAGSLALLTLTTWTIHTLRMSGRSRLLKEVKPFMKQIVQK